MTTKETAAATTTKQAAARQRAFAQLDATFRSGVTRPLRWRKAQLDAMARMLRQNATVIARAVRADLGKPAAETALMEIGLVLDEIRFIKPRLGRWAARHPKPMHYLLQPAVGWTVAEPKGVALIISPWNYPVLLSFEPMADAIAAGNCVCMKPSELSPHTSGVMADLIAADVRVKLDDSDQSMGWKCAEYEMRGVPIRLELGPRDLAEGNCYLVRRDNGEKVTAKIEGIVDEIKALLDAIHDNMYAVAEKNLEDNTFDLKTIDEVKEMASGRGGFARTKWCGSLECELKMKEVAGVSSRCMPLKQSGTTGKCVCCGKECTTDIYWGVAY